MYINYRPRSVCEYRYERILYVVQQQESEPERAKMNSYYNRSLMGACWYNIYIMEETVIGTENFKRRVLYPITLYRESLLDL